MPAALFFVLGILGAVAAALVNRWQRERRRAEMRETAAALGLSFAPHDVLGLLDEPYEVFRLGDGRGVDAVLWGEWRGLPIRLADYWYYVNRQSGKNRTRTYHRLSVAMVGLDVHAPHLAISPEGVFGRIADAMGFRDIELESEEFNREFTVRCTERKFASDVLDARMMAWLLAYARGRSIELGGDFALTSARRMTGADLTGLLAFLADLREHLPRVVGSLYGTEPTPSDDLTDDGSPT